MDTPQHPEADAVFENFRDSAALEPMPQWESGLQNAASNTLKETKVPYRSLFEANPLPMWIYDRETLRFLLVNNAAIEHYGYSQEEFLAMTLMDIRPSADVALLSEALLKAKASSVPNRGKRGVWRHKKKNGGIIDVEITVNDLRFQGRAARLGLVNDITERRRSERTLQHIMEGAHCLLWQAEVRETGGAWLHWEVQFASEQAALRFLPLHVPAGQSYENAWYFSRPEEEREQTDLYGTQAVRAGRSYQQEFRIQSTDGALHWLSENVRVETLGEGKWRCTGVCMDVTEQKRAEAERDQFFAAKVQAEAANLAKSEFLSRMSHELRTPLNAILGFGQILNAQPLTLLQQESVQYILTGGRHLLSLINEVLDLARVEAGHIELSLEPIALVEIISESCALVRPLAAERNITLDAHAVARQSYVRADRQSLKQALINLLSNAIKYNHPGGHVQIHCFPRPDNRMAIAVQDTGPGISMEDQQRLFLPFERLSAGLSAVEGTGLGLVMAQRLVVAMGGSLTLESLPGEGTTFFLELPLVPSPVERLADLPIGRYEPKLDLLEGAKATVLSIEDNLSNMRLLEVLLRSRPGTTLLTAMQGSIGLDLARQHVPDLILLDLNLPDLSGREVLSRLQASALTRDIPVVILSADATASQIERLLNAGARAYLTKPLDVSKFLHTLETLLPSEKMDDFPEKEFNI